MSKPKPYSKRKRGVYLTNDQWRIAVEALREQARNTVESRDWWLGASEETNPDGSPKYPNAAKNAEYLTERITILADIAAEIDNLQR